MGVETALIIGGLVSAGVGAASAAGAFDKNVPEPDLKVPEPDPVISDAEISKEARRQRVLASRRVGADALVVPIDSPGQNLPL